MIKIRQLLQLSFHKPEQVVRDYQGGCPQTRYGTLAGWWFTVHGNAEVEKHPPYTSCRYQRNFLFSFFPFRSKCPQQLPLTLRGPACCRVVPSNSVYQGAWVALRAACMPPAGSCPRSPLSTSHRAAGGLGIFAPALLGPSTAKLASP